MSARRNRLHSSFGSKPSFLFMYACGLEVCQSLVPSAYLCLHDMLGNWMGGPSEPMLPSRAGRGVARCLGGRVRGVTLPKRQSFSSGRSDREISPLSQSQLVQLSSSPIPSTSRPEPVVRRPAEHVHINPDDAIISHQADRTRLLERHTFRHCLPTALEHLGGTIEMPEEFDNSSTSSSCFLISATSRLLRSACWARIPWCPSPSSLEYEA